MSKLDRDAIAAAISEKLGATPDPDGSGDLVASQGRIAINGGDLFSANPKTMGSKVGILDPTGKVLKAADLPRPK